MGSCFLLLAVMLLFILMSAQLFSNALEYFGEKINISAGVTGSVFAAIATALPETTVPILAMISGTSDRVVNQEISMGAILGAPLMLSTLSTFVMALSVIRKRNFFGKIAPEKTGFVRDLNFFLGAFTLASIAMFIPQHLHVIKLMIGVVLVGLYIAYLTCTFKASSALVEDGHGVEPNEPLLLTKFGLNDNAMTIVIQLVLGLSLLLLGAKGFIFEVGKTASLFGISALILSLLIIPIATELPEKINSILWIRKNKDTLAFSNITGAMVFQGTLLPALGIFLTPWQPNSIVMTGMFITLLAAAWLRFNASSNGIKLAVLFVNGLLYFFYLRLMLS